MSYWFITKFSNYLAFVKILAKVAKITFKIKAENDWSFRFEKKIVTDLDNIFGELNNCIRLTSI
jgi:hypothetical protein